LLSGKYQNASPRKAEATGKSRQGAVAWVPKLCTTLFGKENPPAQRRERGILSPGEEESFKRKSRHMLMARNKAFHPAPRKVKL